MEPNAASTSTARAVPMNFSVRIVPGGADYAGVSRATVRICMELVPP